MNSTEHITQFEFILSKVRSRNFYLAMSIAIQIASVIGDWSMFFSATLFPNSVMFS